MRWLWSEWGGKRSRSQTRPRVARAVQVARLAQGAAMHAGNAHAGEGPHWMAQATLGSAYADTRATFFAPEVAPTSGVLYWEAGRIGWVRGDSHERQNVQMTAEAKSNYEHGAVRSEEVQSGAGLVNNVETKAKRRAKRGLSASLLRAAAEVAQALGRSPEEALAEALQAWLTAQESVMQPSVAVAGAGADGSPRRRPMEVRRQEVWEEIDETLKALRAS